MAIPKPFPVGNEPVLAPGDVLARKYRLLEPLGEGGMAVVWVAQNMALETRVAVKILRAGLIGDPRLVARFRQEAKATAAIAHKNIVQVYDYGVTNWGAPFIVMELLQGETLAHRLKTRGPMAPDEAVRTMMRAMKGITVAHAKGVIHRDLKPDNVFLVREESGIERPKVLDFGVSFVARKNHDDRLTKAGGMLGTPSYLPPEAIEGDSRGDVRGDVWALGVMLYEVITGQLPFRGKSVHALLDAICKEKPRPMAELAPEVDAALQAIVSRALAKDPQERFPGVREFYDELSVWMNRRGLLLSAAMPSAAALRELPGLPSVLPDDPDEDDPTLIGPSLESSSQMAASMPAADRAPSATHERSRSSHPPQLASPVPPQVSARSSRPRPPAPARSTVWLGGALGAVALVVATLVGAQQLRPASGVQPRPSSDPAAPASAAPTADAPAGASASAAPSASSPADEATVDIVGLPDQALVRIDGRKVDALPVVIGRGRVVHLRVDAPGHEPWQQEVTIEGSVKLRYSSRPLLAPAPPRPSPGSDYRQVPY